MLLAANTIPPANKYPAPTSQATIKVKMRPITVIQLGVIGALRSGRTIWIAFARTQSCTPLLNIMLLSSPNCPMPGRGQNPFAQAHSGDPSGQDLSPQTHPPE